jgi:hypothetical protein
MALPHRVAKKSLPMPIGVLYVASRVALAGLRYATLSPLITLWERRNPEVADADRRHPQGVGALSRGRPRRSAA